MKESLKKGAWVLLNSKFPLITCEWLNYWLNWINRNSNDLLKIKILEIPFIIEKNVWKLQIEIQNYQK